MLGKIVDINASGPKLTAGLEREKKRNVVRAQRRRSSSQPIQCRRRREQVSAFGTESEPSVSSKRSPGM